MKALLLAVLGLCGILIRVLGWLPWESRRPRTQGPVRFNFLLVLSIVALGIVFFSFWFAMRMR